MGYTHYASRRKRLPLALFRLAAEDCRKVVDVICQEQGVHVQFDRDDPKPAHFGDDSVQFNGVEEEAHETFVVERTYTPYPGQEPPSRGEGWFEFTKTARKPYDCAVCACLIVFQHHFDAAYTVRSDGDDLDPGWVTARACCQRVLGYGADFTLKVPPRMTLKGLAFAGGWAARGEADGQVRVLSNGWELRKARGTSLRYELYDPGTTKNGGFVVCCDLLGPVVWHATVLHLQREFAEAPFLDEFAGAMLERRGEWTPFLAWSDKLQDHGHDELAWKVRERIPRSPARR